MSTYTITITPDDTTRASTTVRVDVSDDTARITEYLVRSGTPNGLVAHQLPAVDLDLLLRAVLPGAGKGGVRASVRPTVEEAPRRRAATRGRRGAKATSAKAETPTKATKAARTTAKKAVSGGERAYRRAPGDLVQVFNELGGVTAVARHYGVPRHTAQSWVRRMRNEGRLPAGR